MFFEKNGQSVRQQSQEWALPCPTRSVCPECGQILEATLFDEDHKVWMTKTCPEHGHYTELISSDTDFFLHRRRTHYEFPTGVTSPHVSQSGNCPFDCGLCANHLSTPCQVNIDLTNRCNLNCPICFANANAKGRVFDFTLEQLEPILDKALAMRPNKPVSIQYAGGEPTIHPDFIEAVRMAKDKGTLDVQVASNGLKFAQSEEFTRQAAEAGLNVVYLQFDGLTDDIYTQSRGRPLVETKDRAIENLRKHKIMVCLVPTIVKGMNDHQLGDILNYAIENSDVVTAVSFQPVSLTGRIDASQRQAMRYTMADMARDIQAQTGILDMYRDWYPYSIINPVSRLVEALTGEPKVHFNCHPHCGVATYMIIDKETGQTTPLTKFLDLEAAMADINAEAEAIEKHPWRKKLTRIQILRKLKKHFDPDQAPEGLEFEHIVNFVNGFINAKDLDTYKNRGRLFHLMGDRFNVMLLTAMHFQDNYNFELDRVQHCVIHYAAPNGRFYPFCTWNSGPCHRIGVEEAYSRPLSK